MSGCTKYYFFRSRIEYNLTSFKRKGDLEKVSNNSCLSVSFCVTSESSWNTTICDNVLWGKSWSSPPDVFLGKGVLKIYSKFTGEQSCWSAISIKMCHLTKITLRHECSPLNLLYIFRTPFYKNTCGGVLPSSIIILVWNYMCQGDTVFYGKSKARHNYWNLVALTKIPG